MIGFKIRYLVNAFCDVEFITVKLENITRILELFKDEQLLPVAVTDINSEGKKVERMGFRTQNKDTQILFRGDRIEYVKLTSDLESSNLGTFEDFCHFAGEKLSEIIEGFNLISFRLSAVQEGLFNELSEGEMQKIGERLLNKPPTFNAHAPFEWDWKVISKIEWEYDSIFEPTNTIITIKRAAGILEMPTFENEFVFDRIFLTVDINTGNENLMPRYKKEQINNFFSNVGNWHNDLIEELNQFIFSE